MEERKGWMGGRGMALHSKEGLRWELPIGQNLAIVPAIKLIIGTKNFEVWGGGGGEFNARVQRSGGGEGIVAIGQSMVY
jgi:hypothetical protein